MSQNTIKPYLYFNEKTLINGSKYTLNIKSDNSTIKNIDTNIIYIYLSPIYRINLMYDLF